MKIPSRIIDLAVQEAKKSNHYLFKIGCVIFNKNKIISKGFNRKEIIKGFFDSRVETWNDDIVSIHAEIASLIKADGKDLDGSTALVIRITKKNKFALAKPCKNCWAHLKSAGVKTVIYSINKYPYLKMEKIR